MGRLKRKLVIKKANKHKKWLAVVVSVLMVGGAAGYYYQQHSLAGLLSYAGKNRLKTGVELVDGYGQIYYEYKGKKRFVTNDDANHQSPVANGSEIVWLDELNGQYQVVLYSLETKQRLSLSFIGSNTNPSVDNGKVAWQGVWNDRSVIYYFDGTKVRRISSDVAAIRPYVHNNRVLYAQKRGELWQAVLYDAKRNTSTVVTEGSANKAAWPRFENGKIRTTLKNSAKYYY